MPLLVLSHGDSKKISFKGNSKLNAKKYLRSIKKINEEMAEVFSGQYNISLLG